MNFEPEFARAIAAEIAFGVLIYIQRYDLDVWLPPHAGVRIAHQESVAHVLSMRLQPVNRRDNGEAFRLPGLGRRRSYRGGLKKCAASQHVYVLQNVDSLAG